MKIRLCGAVLAPLMWASVAAAEPPSVVHFQDLKPREVRSVVFTLAAPQDLLVRAVGAESDHDSGTFSWLSAVWNGHDDRRPREPWIGNAWILDLATREVAWELSAASTERGHAKTRVFDGTVHLAAGTYEAFYSAFPSSYFGDEDGGGTTRRFMNWMAGQDFGDLSLSIDGRAQVLTGADADRARRADEAGAVLALHGDGSERYLQSGFTLERPTTVELYAVGEVREDAEFDTGWIVNADTHERVWKMNWRDSSPAGGATKNRVARLSRTLPAGRYVAFYATDDSHDAHAWNAPPPHDPDAWGLVVRIPDSSARAAVTTFAYDDLPDARTIVALTGVGDRESRRRGFTLARPMDVRVYALGEASGTRLVDYGWITDAASHEKVWEMRYADTEPAGGDPKNRIVDGTIDLGPGSYLVHYVTDDSHSAGAWNAPAPPAGNRWGITVLAAGKTLDRSAVGDYVERTDPNLLAQLVGVRDDQRPRARFVLDRETTVSVFALGESSGGSMADYGWLEDAKTGRTVWEMRYRDTGPAGGASKNRKFEGRLILAPGEYLLRFQTDGSHAFGSWNAAPPDDPDMWGISLYRVK